MLLVPYFHITVCPVPIKALARMARGKFRALLRRKCFDLGIPDAV